MLIKTEYLQIKNILYPIIESKLIDHKKCQKRSKKIDPNKMPKSAFTDMRGYTSNVHNMKSESAWTL